MSKRHDLAALLNSDSLEPMEPPPSEETAMMAVGDDEALKAWRAERTPAIIEVDTAEWRTLREGEEVLLPLPGGRTATITIHALNAEQALDSGRIGGSVQGGNGGCWLSIQSGRLNGVIELRDSQEAYRITSATNGLGTIRKVEPEQAKCGGIPPADPDRLRKPPALGPTSEAPSLNPPILQSRPNSGSVIYLDFDGERVQGTAWNNTYTQGKPIEALRFDVDGKPGYSPAEVDQMERAWERIAEDYRPFDVNVTTDARVYEQANAARRIRCIVTSTMEWYGRAGGVAYVGSFAWGDGTPCWVWEFQTDKTLAEAASHEIGHTLGLEHMGRKSPKEEYFEGHGSGATGWAPIMGAAYYQEVTQWSRGEYLSANNTEDEIALITRSVGIRLIDDDHRDADPATSTPLVIGRDLTFGAEGVLRTSIDIDMFSLVVPDRTTLDLHVNPVNRGPNCHLHARLTLADGQLVGEASSDDSLSVHFARPLEPGHYFISVAGRGVRDPKVDGYSTYGCLGQYILSGSFKSN